MKNVYDIVLNFKKIAYEFYEWDKSDNIIHVKCIPSIKVSTNCIIDLMNNNIVLDKNVLEQIRNKTEVFSNKKIKKIEYAIILYNDEISLAFMFNKEGNILGRSKLLFDESDDLVLSGLSIEPREIDYNIISKINYNNLCTRKQFYISNVLLDYIKNLYNEKKYDELKYIYFECYDYSENDFDKMYSKLSESINNINMIIINKILSIIKVLKK